MTALAAQEVARSAVHSATNCVLKAGVAAEMITDVGDIVNDVVKGKVGQAAVKTYLSGWRAAISVVLCHAGPAGWLANVCLDHAWRKLKFRK